MNILSRLDLFQKYLENAGLDQKPYQRNGVEWCLSNELGLFDGSEDDDNIYGGIIADEMGLGKTITMIGVCISNVMRKTLIVLPVILIDQWASQIYKTTGHRPLIYHGLHKKKINLAMLNNSVIVLTSYQTIIKRKNKNKENVLNLLHSVRWNRLIFDEAHHLRNSNTKLFKDCYSLQSNIRWLMTGTPIQNREKDFHSLCSMLRIPIHKVVDDNFKKQFILRRTKKDVGIPLPPLNYHLEKVNWSNMNEMSFSKDLHSYFGLNKIVHREKKKEIDLEKEIKETSSITNLFLKGRGSILRFMNASKQICILPKLLKHTLDVFVSSGEISTYNPAMISSTSKMNAVISEITNKRENGNGKLIFCHYHLEMMYLYEKFVESGIKVLIYGKMPKSMGYVTPLIVKNNLNDLDYDIIIIQIQTGCEGLNLQKYNEVYFVSPNWNPMIEEQAIARCHRIGQKKSVFVSHFVMNNFENDTVKSLDHYILDTQERKRGCIFDTFG